MSTSLARICLTAVAGCAIFGQSTAPPSFEVASVKPVTPLDQGRFGIGLFTYPGGRIRATNYTLRQLVHDAYSVEMHQILGGPGWVDNDRYIVEAKPPDSSDASKWIPANTKVAPNPELRLMLQTLLADRFHLKLHRESKAETVYALVVAKGGHKLKEPKDRSLEPFVSFGRTGPVTADALSQTITGHNATMDILAYRLSQRLRRPVSNQTGIQGNFDFLVEYAGNDAQSAAAPPLERAIQDSLGLKLNTQPGSIEVLIIDHAERPSAN